MQYKLALLLLILSLGIVANCNSRAKRTAPYIIARDSNWEQCNFYGSEKNVTGFADDLLFEIAKVENIKVQLLNSSKSPLVSLLDQSSDGKEIDAVITAMNLTDQALRQYEFSEPFFIFGPVLVVREGAPYNTLKEMNARIIGYQRGYMETFQFVDTTKATFIPYDDLLHAFDDLRNQRIDGIIVDSIQAYRLVSRLYKGEIKVTGAPLISMGLRLAVKKGTNAELVTLFNAGLEKVKKEHLYEKIIRYWGLFDASDPKSALLESPSTF